MTQQYEEEHPTVSVGMPVFNGSRYIKDAIESILNQTYTHLELIISDNGSTDSTETICREYAEKDSRVKYIRQPQNIGLIGNFKYVLSQANGDFFMWAAHDDRRAPTAVERMLEVLLSDKSVGVVFSDMIVRDLITGAEENHSVGYVSAQKAKHRRYLHQLLNGNCLTGLCGLHRKHILDRFELTNFDYFDVHLTHWYELNSTVKVVPLYLYICGTDGARMPYSLTGRKLTIRTFLDKEWIELRRHFSRVTATVLFAVTAYFMYLNNCRNNKRR